MTQLRQILRLGLEGLPFTPSVTSVTGKPVREGKLPTGTKFTRELVPEVLPREASFHRLFLVLTLNEV